MAPTSWAKCRHVGRKDAIMQRCSSCKKWYHDVCQTLAVEKKSLNNGPVNTLICEDCKILHTNSKTKSSNKATQDKDKLKSHEKSLISPFLASTPVHPVADVKALTLAKRGESRIHRKDTSNYKFNSSLTRKENNNNGTSNSDNNNSNDNISSNSSSTKSFSAIGCTSPAAPNVTARHRAPAKQTIKHKPELVPRRTSHPRWEMMQIVRT